MWPWVAMTWSAMTSGRRDRLLEVAPFLLGVFAVALLGRAILGLTGDDPAWLVVVCIALSLLSGYATVLFTLLRRELRRQAELARPSSEDRATSEG